MKKRIVKLFSLITVLALCIVGMFATTVFSVAEEKYSPESIFKASVGASYTAPEGSGDKFVTYEMGASSNVTYGKNLALKWYENGTAKYFSTVVAFSEVNFTEFSITLEAAQHTMNKEEKSVNEITFKSATQVSVNGGAEVAVSATNGEYVIAISETASSMPDLDGTTGEFYVTVNGTYVGTFKNIGANFAEYKSGTITPLTFAVKGMQDGKDKQTVEIRELNTQKMKLNDDGKVVDDTNPVFVLNDEVKVLKLGETLSLSYKTIDVLDSSISTQYFYSVYEVDTIDAAKKPEEDASGYKKVDSMSKLVFFEYDGKDGKLDADGNLFVSIAFRLDDGDNETYYYLEDYATGFTKGSETYVKVAKEVDSRPVYTTDSSKINAYITEVENAAKVDGKSIQIGSGAYYYLPSLRSLISDENCGYTDLEFNIYYRNQTTENGSSTGLSYNALKLAVSTPGVYEFKVVATNAFGKTMLNGAGDKEITSSNVWEETSIPSFTFTVENTGPSVEEKQSSNDLGYIDVAYTFPAFDIVALAGYTSEYKLYRLDGDTANVKLEDLEANPSNYTWVEISEYDAESDSDDNDFEWRASSRSFIPQKAGYYMITVKVVDSDRLSAEAHQVVSVTSKVTTVRGETYWLRDNIVSIVFMVIGGICLIAIIVLLVVKPKEAEETTADKKSKKQALKEKRENRK